MKRHSLICAATILLLVLLIAAAAIASIPINYNTGAFPNYKPGLYPTLGNCQVTLPIQQGWFNNVAAWYFCTDTNNIQYATQQHLTLSPRLDSALDNGARRMFIVTNFNNVGPVFETAPRAYNQTPYVPTYSGLWEIIFVYWNPGTTPHIIKNADLESPMNPYGLPPTDATYSSSGFVNLVNGVPTPVPGPRIVVDCPIVALGTLEQPFNNPQFGGIYRIPQVIALDSRYKTITLPTWNVYCRNNITLKIEVQEVIIPDVEDLNLAKALKANLAPGLADVPFSDTQNFWIVNWLQPFNGGVLVESPTQYAVTEECPNCFPPPTSILKPAQTNGYFYSNCQNTNFEYTPVYQALIVNRNILPEFPGFTDKTVITSTEFIDILLGNGSLTVISANTKLNAPNIMQRKVAIGAR